MNSRETIEYVQKANLVILDGKLVKSREYIPVQDVAWFGDYHLVTWDKDTKVLVLKSLSNRREGRAVPIAVLGNSPNVSEREKELERFLVKHIDKALDELEAGMQMKSFIALSGRINDMRFALSKLQQLCLTFKNRS